MAEAIAKLTLDRQPKSVIWHASAFGAPRPQSRNSKSDTSVTILGRALAATISAAQQQGAEGKTLP